MLKHIGKHGDKKVTVLFREVPNETHMCLIVYSDILPRIYHDMVMKVLESPVGQQAENLADALFRNMMPDGINSLEALHKNGLIKKVPTNQVIMTPTTVNTIRLDELNDLLNEMKKGEDAIKRLSEIDASKGMSGKKKVIEPQEVGVPPASRARPAETVQASLDEVLSDSDLARSRVLQAHNMKKSAEELYKEAARLLEEAKQLDPTVTDTVAETTVKSNATRTKKKTVKTKEA